MHDDAGLYIVPMNFGYTDDKAAHCTAVKKYLNERGVIGTSPQKQLKYELERKVSYI